MDPAKYDPNTGMPVGQVQMMQQQPVMAQQQPVMAQPMPVQGQVQPVYVPVQGQPMQAQAVQGIPMNVPANNAEKPKLEPPFPGSTAIERWGGGIFGCTEDCGGCILACFCPCIVYGQNMEEAFGAQTHSCVTQGLIYVAACILPSCVGCPNLQCFVTCSSRKQLNSHLKESTQGGTMDENDCNACFCHFCCEACTLNQETRAIRAFKKAGGYDQRMQR